MEQRHEEHVKAQQLTSTPQNIALAVGSYPRRRIFRSLLAARDWIAAVLFYALWPILVLMSGVPLILWLLGARL